MKEWITTHKTEYRGTIVVKCVPDCMGKHGYVYRLYKEGYPLHIGRETVSETIAFIKEEYPNATIVWE